MCQIVVKQAGSKFNIDNLKKAQKHNEDGYSITWWENDMVNVFKTFDFSKATALATTMKEHTAVFHMRYATKGDKSYENLHPFEIPSGYVIHNGTMYGLGNTSKSDTAEFADILNGCEYKYIEDIEPLIKPFIDDKINRLVFFEDNGRVTIMNEALGTVEGGLWYSNSYHKKDEGWCRAGCKPNPKPKDKPKMEIVRPKKHKVFVYGTLKRGYHNHRLLINATMLGKATTVDNWTMVGKNMAFPYVIEQHDELGTNVVGEVYHVSDDELRTLNTLEGVPYHYKPQLVEVEYDDDTIDEVLMYVKTIVPTNYTSTQMLISEWKSA